jgi:hypothetical protein
LNKISFACPLFNKRQFLNSSKTKARTVSAMFHLKITGFCLGRVRKDFHVIDFLSLTKNKKVINQENYFRKPLAVIVV